MENQVFQKDELVKKKYEVTKKYFDRLHREFVAESLKDLRFYNKDLENYEKASGDVKNITNKTLVKDKNRWKKELEKQEKNLRKKRQKKLKELLG